MTEEIDEIWISGFWRRIGALFIDSLILGIVGFLLGLMFEGIFVEIGAWGRLIGFSIALIYFGILNSRIGSGQTIGKKVLKLRVVNSKNETIGLGRSLLRYTVLAVPFSLNGAQFSNEAMLSYLVYPLSLIVFGGMLSITYLYVFNRITRQSLHDLAVGTFVVNSDVGVQETGSVWKVHLIAVITLFIAATLVPAFTSQLAQSEPFKDMLTAQEALLNEAAVKYASVTTSSTTFTSSSEGSKTTTYVTAKAFLTENNVQDIELARRLAALVAANYPESKNKDLIQVTLTYGYDIGIWSQWHNHNHQFSPNEIQNAK